MPSQTKHFIISNFGNESLALIAWCITQGSDNLTILYVDTGWAATGWQQHVNECIHQLKSYSLSFKRLQSPAEFRDLVIDRRQFPSKKFQWCAGFLKGLAINAYLDEVDPLCESKILLAKRKTTSRANRNLLEFDEDNEYYNYRTVWHPLLNCDDDTLRSLIDKLGLNPTYPRSLECQPCIHSTHQEYLNMDEADKQKLLTLEQTVGVSMFSESIETSKKPGLDSEKVLERLDMGCGAPWACGT